MLVIHICIAYSRYYYNIEYSYPIWWEFVSIIFGMGFIFDGYCTKNLVIIILGIIIIIGHYNKILCSSCPYYF
mgnify:CR=1 FL=1